MRQTKEYIIIISIKDKMKVIVTNEFWINCKLRKEATFGVST